jgi:hypothetical protein
MDNPSVISDACAIEKLSHVQKRICMTWATPELDGYINHLLTDSRDGKRSGFPLEVTAELLFLVELNKLVRAIDVARRLKIPLKEAYQKVDLQDRGAQLGDPKNDPLVARDMYAREEQEFGTVARPVKRVEQKGDGFAAMFGKGVFALFTSKVVLFIIAVFLAYQYLLPLLFKK